MKTNKVVSKRVFALLAGLFSLVLCQCAAGTISGYRFPDGTETAFAKKATTAEVEYAELLAKAQAGDTTAQVEIGIICRNGKKGIVPADYFAAYQWFNSAAQQGSAEAMFQIGNMHSYGIIGPLELPPYRAGGSTLINYQKVLSWYNKAAEKNHAGAQKAIGDIYSMEYQNWQRVKPNYDEAMKWYRKAADNGNGYAMVELFRKYQFGYESVEKNIEEAKKWFNKIVENGDPESLIELGEILYSYGDEEQKAVAVKLLTQAAEQDWVWAQYYLGINANVKWRNMVVNTALESGNAQLLYAIAPHSIYYIMDTPGGPARRAGTEPTELYRKAAENGNARMSYDIAKKFYYGDGVQKDYAEAYKWFYKAATEGLTMMTTDYMPNMFINWYADACQKLGTMYAEGQGVPQNRSEGEKWAIMIIDNKTTMNEWGPAQAKWEKETLEKVNVRWRQILGE
jgi:FOG: TPR repeat, SEL1 subfamily